MPTDGFKRLFTKWSSLNNRDSVTEPLNKKHSKAQVELPVINSIMVPLLKAFNKALTLVLFFLLNFLSQAFFGVYYVFNGTYFKLRMSRKPANYNWSARVSKILLRHKYDNLVNQNSILDFILLHEEFVHPSRVLTDEVTLYEVTDTEAVFVEAAPGVEVWRSKYGAFTNDAQHTQARKVIVLPIESFYKLAEEIGDPQGRLVFITNTARCGSTLLSRIYEETDNFVTIAEPTAVNNLFKYVGREDNAWVQHHSRAVIRMLCKPTHVNNYAIKITPPSTSIVPLLQKLYPNASQVFIYRDGLPSAKSMFKIWLELPMGTINLLLAKHFHSLYVWLLNWANFYGFVDNQKEKLTINYGYGQGCYYWGSVISQYRKYRRMGLHIAGIKYEDLVKDKTSAVEKLFDYCAVPKSFIQPALRAFNTDSQANSRISMSNLKRYKLPDFTPDIERETDKICEYFGVPKLGESCVLEGTLTREVEKCPIKS